MAQTILLVDDSATIRNIIKVYLMGQPFEFVEAEDGERALRLLRLVPVHLVVADIRMPGMDGITFVRTLRSDEREKIRGLPVILLTGDKSDELRKQGVEAGANDFILKPVTGAALVEVVNRLLPRGAP